MPFWQECHISKTDVSYKEIACFHSKIEQEKWNGNQRAMRVICGFCIDGDRGGYGCLNMAVNDPVERDDKGES